MDFFHCIRCAHWPMFQPENRLRYFLSSCGRLYCENCMTAITSKCLCGTNECKMLEIKAQSGKELKAFFTEPVSLLQSIQESMKKPLQILQFQNTLQKNCLRNVGKLVETLKAMKNENNSLKSDANHLRQNNESLKQQIEQLKTKVAELTQANNASTSFLSNSHSMNNAQINRLNSPSPDGHLNLFGQYSQRPNAQVPPNVHLPSRSIPPTPVQSSFGTNNGPKYQSTVGFVVPSVSPSPSATPDRSHGQFFSNLPGFSRPFSHQARMSPSMSNPSPVSFGTPASSISQLSTGGGIRQNSFTHRNERTASVFSTPGHNQTTPTPEIINRLRNLKCTRMTPNSALRGEQIYRS